MGIVTEFDRRYVINTKVDDFIKMLSRINIKNSCNETREVFNTGVNLLRLIPMYANVCVGK